jgi:tetratricopeptide (TPR) repeat protein
MFKKFIVFIPILLIILLSNCGIKKEQSEFDKSLSLFFNLKYQDALPLFKQVIEQEPNNDEALTWLAETYRRIGKTNDAIEAARKALLLNPRSSFAHLVIAYASYPNDDSIWVHAKEAVKCDSTDPNAWLMMWGEAIKHNNLALHDKTLRKLRETGFLTKAALAYGRVELRDLPPNAIYITNGDMDTYPAKVVQISESFRTDIVVIEKEHLGINWAARFIRDHNHIPLPISDAELDKMKVLKDAHGNIISTSEQNFRKWIEQKRKGSFNRPIALAPTVEQSYYEFDKEHFHYCGMYLLWKPEPAGDISDTSALRQYLSEINIDDFTGPWASLKDRSPVRRYYSKQIVRVLFQAALNYSRDLITAKRFNEAKQTLTWLEVFEKQTEIGLVSTDEINKLKEIMKE